MYFMRKRGGENSLRAARETGERFKSMWTNYNALVEIKDCAVCQRYIDTSCGAVKYARPAERSTQTSHEPTTLTHTDAVDKRNNQPEPDHRPTAEETYMETNTELALQSTQSVSEGTTLLTNAGTTQHTQPELRPTVGEHSMQATDQETHALSTDNTLSIPTDISFTDNLPPTSHSTPLKQKPQLVECATSPILNTYTNKPHKHQALTDAEEALFANLVQRKLAQSKDNIIKCKTRGQPIYLMKITKHRKSSADVTSPTRRKRTLEMTRVRQHVAGPPGEATQTQQAHELKRNAPSTRQDICRKAGVVSKVRLDSKYALAMKETVGLTWSQERVLRRFLKESGVQMANEHSERKCMKDIVEDDVCIKTKPFTASNGQLKETPLVFIKDLQNYVIKMLDKLKDGLTWHDGYIPEDEIWVKAGADYGKGSFKLSLAIANTQNPNSKLNTILIAMAKASDSRENMDLFFEEIKTPLQGLDNMSWEGKKVKLFLFGDYAFLTKVYGLSGASGTYPCLWCLIRNTDIQCPQEQEMPHRTLTQLHRDYSRFILHGQGLKHASCFNNSIHPPLLDMPLHRVVPPYLHCLLGITLRHHKLLEKAADEIDSLIFHDEGTKNEEIKNFKTFGSNCILHQTLIEKSTFYQGCLLISDRDEEKMEWQTKFETAEKQIANLREAALKERCGPVCSSLDHILDTNKITPQAYHSRSFIGNHCHRYYVDKVYEKLTKQITDRTIACTDNKLITDKAFQVRAQFNTINEAYAQVHAHISHTNPLQEDAIPTIKRAIDNYMKLYRKFCPQKVLPKHHILEEHCLDFIKQHRFGLGLLGEQGGELIHSTISKLEKRGHAMKNEATQLETIMQSSLVQASPDLQSLVPAKKRRTNKIKL